MHTLKLFPSLVWFEAKRFSAYPLEAIANIIERSIGTVLFILLWLIISQHSGDSSLNTKEIISYFLIIGGLTPFLYAGMGIAGMFSKLIKNGELNQLLLRPVNVLVYPWAIRTGRNALNILVGSIQIIIGLLIVTPTISINAAMLLVPVLLNAFLINAAFNVLLGSLGFYFIEVKGFISTFVHIARLLRGELIPLFLMPIGLQVFLQFTPFPASMYHLVGLLQGTYIPEFWQVGIGALWSIVLLLCARKFWQIGLRQYEAIGL